MKTLDILKRRNLILPSKWIQIEKTECMNNLSDFSCLIIYIYIYTTSQKYLALSKIFISHPKSVMFELKN